jgi:hypothetical protein
MWQREYFEGEEITMAVAVVVLMIWAMATYALFFKDHGLARFLEERLASRPS